MTECEAVFGQNFKHSAFLGVQPESRLEGKFPTEVKFLPKALFDDWRRFATENSVSAQVLTRSDGDHLVVKGPEMALTESVDLIADLINFYFPDHD